ncbi:MAG: hypothetical protein WCB19_07325 [Thermoplasmata archaeon]
MASAVNTQIIEQLRTFEKNLSWAKQNERRIVPFQGEYIVVTDQKVVFHSKRKLDALKQSAGRPGSYVTFVPPKGLAWVL